MSEQLLTSPAPGVTVDLCLCGEEGIELAGQKFVPDATKAYFGFQFSHAFPVATVYQTALHPSVVAASYQTLLHQNVNYEHQLGSYHEDRDVRDRVIGSVVAVDFPRTPPGGWRVARHATEAPGISGVAVVYKQTQGMAKILGDHLTGRRKHTVSMEVMYPLESAGFAVALNGKPPEQNLTPSDLLSAGYEYVPYADAPEELRAVFSRKKNRVVAQYKGRKVFVLMGGLDQPVHYAGAGVVQFGAEPPAKILRLAASQSPQLGALADALSTAFRRLLHPQHP